MLNVTRAAIDADLRSDLQASIAVLAHRDRSASLAVLEQDEAARVTRMCKPSASPAPYRAELHSELDLAASCRRTARRYAAGHPQRRIMKDCALRTLRRVSDGQHSARYWQPIP
jgi:hypothetical protein